MLNNVKNNGQNTGNSNFKVQDIRNSGAVILGEKK